MILLSCDPGLASVGWALLDLSGRRPRCIQLRTQRTSSEDRLQDRLGAIRGTLIQLAWFTPEGATLDPAKPNASVFVVEDQAPGQIAARKLGHTDANAAVARDVQHQLTGKAEAIGLQVVTIAPRTWRSRLGLSRASDAQIKAWVRRMVDGLPKTLSIHAAEAMCIGVAGGREALKRKGKVVW